MAQHLHVLRRTCECTVLRTEVTASVTNPRISVPARRASAARLEQFRRRVPFGCWTIENQVQYVRAVTLGEDAP